MVSTPLNKQGMQAVVQHACIALLQKQNGAQQASSKEQQSKTALPRNLLALVAASFEHVSACLESCHCSVQVCSFTYVVVVLLLLLHGTRGKKQPAVLAPAWSASPQGEGLQVCGYTLSLVSCSCGSVRHNALMP